jgi:hypothetical protein
MGKQSRVSLKAWRDKGQEALAPYVTRVMFAVLDLREKGIPVTHRAILRNLGMPEDRCGLTMEALNQLRQAGLVTWDKEKNGTIRPLCRYISVE